MSTISTAVDDPTLHPEPHGATDKQYFYVFVTLVLLTALEVSTYFWDDVFNADTEKIAVPILIGLMVIKFFLVALFFMHLKYDASLLKRAFYLGMIAAIVLYGGALTSMNFWTDSGNTNFNDPPPVPPAPFVN